MVTIPTFVFERRRNRRKEAKRKWKMLEKRRLSALRKLSNSSDGPKIRLSTIDENEQVCTSVNCRYQKHTFTSAGPPSHLPMAPTGLTADTTT